MLGWILGAAGAAGLVGAAIAGRNDEKEQREERRERNRHTLDAASLDGGTWPDERVAPGDSPDASRPALIGRKANYWDVFELVDARGLDAEDKARRERERDAHTEALARIIASEAGTMSRTVKRAVAWIARNRSLSMKRPLLDMAAPNGEWGAISATRPMSSSQPATDETRALAASVLAESQGEDPIAGATHGFDVPLQDRLAAQGMAGNDSEAVIRIWASHYGLKPVGQVESWVLYK